MTCIICPDTPLANPPNIILPEAEFAVTVVAPDTSKASELDDNPIDLYDTVPSTSSVVVGSSVPIPTAVASCPPNTVNLFVSVPSAASVNILNFKYCELYCNCPSVPFLSLNLNACVPF